MLFFKRKPRGPEIWDFADTTALVRSGAAYVREMLLLGMRSRERVGLCVSAVEPVLRICELLPEAPRQGALQWERIHIFWAWERGEPVDCSAASPSLKAFELVRRSLLSRVPLPDRNIHPLPDNSRPENLKEYGRLVRNCLGPADEDAPPTWDVTLLDLDEQGGLAGLPGTGAGALDTPLLLPEGDYAPCLGKRLGFGLDSFLGSANVIVVASGRHAAPYVRAARKVGDGVEAGMAASFKPSGRLVWFTDQ